MVDYHQYVIYDISVSHKRGSGPPNLQSAGRHGITCGYFITEKRPTQEKGAEYDLFGGTAPKTAESSASICDKMRDKIQ